MCNLWGIFSSTFSQVINDQLLIFLSIKTWSKTAGCVNKAVIILFFMPAVMKHFLEMMSRAGKKKNVKGVTRAMEKIKKAEDLKTQGLFEQCIKSAREGLSVAEEMGNSKGVRSSMRLVL